MSAAIRPARPYEAALLTALCRRSKAHWGNDAAFMAACAAELTVTAERIAAGMTFVREVDGAVAGMYSLDPMDDPARIELDLELVDRHGELLWSRPVAAAVLGRAETVPDVVRQLERALDQLAAEVRDELGAVLAERFPPKSEGAEP